MPDRSRCNSCEAPILWAITAKGRRIPLDPHPRDDGNMRICEDGIARATDMRPAMRSHFQSCPNAARHRRTRRTS